MIILVSFKALRHLSNEELAIFKTIFSEESAVLDIYGFCSSRCTSSNHRKYISLTKKDYGNRGSLCFIFFS